MASVRSVYHTTLLVDYDVKLEAPRYGYGYINRNFNSTNFPPNLEGRWLTEIQLLHFDLPLTFAQVVADIKQLGFQLPTAYDLITLGATGDMELNSVMTKYTRACCLCEPWVEVTLGKGFPRVPHLMAYGKPQIDLGALLGNEYHIPVSSVFLAIPLRKPEV